MKRTLLLSLLLWLLGSGAAGVLARPAPEYELTATGEIAVAADGSVHSYALDAGLPPLVEQLVQKNVAGWRFEPIVEAGRPVIGKTRMTLVIRAQPQPNGNYILQLQDAWFGAATSRGKITPPKYPLRAIKAGIGARVMLAVRIDDEGNVVDVHTHQISLSAPGSEAAERRWRKLFEDASVRTVRNWKYVPGESIGGHPVASTMMVPLVFMTSDGFRAPKIENAWRTYAPGPITPAPWVDDDALVAVDTGALQDGQNALLNPRFKLLSDVIGKAL